jgi:glucan phosphoethanolaminetransferase (alkaline phosphatase superfamily)
MNSCDYHYIFSRGMDAVESYDIDLIEQLKGITTSEGQFVVLHSLGSHFKYSLRYPADAAHFSPALAASDGYDKLTEEHKQLLVNAYDNSILYTDQVLGELIDWVEAQNKQAVIMYISDHGESFWDDERKLSLHGSYELSEAEYHVPCMIWYSDEYQQKFTDKTYWLHNNRDISQNSSVTFSTLLDLAGINEVVDSTRSLCSPCIHAIDSFPAMNGAGELKNYVINK